MGRSLLWWTQLGQDCTIRWFEPFETAGLSTHWFLFPASPMVKPQGISLSCAVLQTWLRSFLVSLLSWEKLCLWICSPTPHTVSWCSSSLDKQPPAGLQAVKAEVSVPSGFGILLHCRSSEHYWRNQPLDRTQDPETMTRGKGRGLIIEPPRYPKI